MSEETVVRAFELPCRALDREVADRIRESWRQSTELANWCARRLLAAEQWVPGSEKMPPMPKLNLYSEAGKAFGLMEPDHWWAGAAGSFSAVTKAVTDYWRQHRFAVRQGRERPPHWLSPYPFPIRSQEWTGCGFDAAGKPWVEVNLPSGTPRKPLHATLPLRGGPEFGRQLALFRQVVSGELPKLQLVIRGQRCSHGCHRPTTRTREPERILVKMVARLPCSAPTGQRTLTLCTDPAAFWVAELDGRSAWVLNADHVKRACDWLAIHESRRQRYAQDRKAERRLDPGTDHWRRSLERCCAKHDRRMASWLHETAAHLTGFAIRQRVGLVLYDDDNRGFAPLFPWHKLGALLADKLKAAGIVCQRTSGKDVLTAEEVIALDTNEEDGNCLRTMREGAMAAKRLLQAQSRSKSHPGVSTPSGTAQT